jgi:N-acetylneuraminic acid mutarotase
VAAAANAPGGRSDAVAWTDASGKLWLFGGWGCDGASNSSRLNDLWKYEISTGYWTWVKGLKAIKQYGTYGTQGVAAATNAPGARQQATLWKDALGVPWLFGGQGYDGSGNAGYLGDLWKYDALTGNWTWAKGSSTSNQSGIYGTQGVADSANMPGGRQGAASWVDASVTSRTLWLFGGQGKDATGAQGCLNDLWNYDATTGNWTWVKGSSTSNQAGTYGTQGVADAANAPGARSAAVAWTDASGNLWLFGGQGYDGSGNVGDLSDLWKYDASAGNWTWVNGSNTVGQAGTYGTQGVADAANMPGGRQGAASWVDASVTSRTLWLFGGQGYDGSGNAGYLSDLWKYDVTTGNWTWVNGSSASNQAGAYGTQGIADAANAPGARDAAVSWKDASGNLWLFGGQGDDGSGNAGYLNDLWKYNPTRGYWTWVNGSNTSNQTGAYWTQGVAAAANAPGARSAPVSWIDASGKLWLFGGQGYDCGGAVVSYLNDLWSGEISTLSGAQEWRGYP